MNDSIRNLLPLILLVAVAAVLRFLQLDLRSLWLDEATSLDVASHSLSEILGGRAFNNHTPPFYYLLLHLWLKVFPATEWGMRSLSAALDVINTGLVVSIFSRQFSRRAGISAGLLYAISPFAIYYAQEARMYPLVMLLGLISYSCALRYLSRPTNGAWQVGLVAVAVAGLYTHYFYAFFLASISAALFWYRRRELKQLLPWMLPLVAAGICFLPWVKVVTGLASGPGQTFRQFVFTVPPYSFFRFTAGYGLMPLTFGLKDDMRQTVMHWMPVILPFMAVFGILLLVGLKRALASAGALLFLAALVGPAAISFALAAKMNILSERYWAISFPYFVGALALLPWGETRPRYWLAIELVAAALWTSASLSHFTNPAFGFSDWRRAAELAAAEPNALVAIRPGFNRDVLRFYLGNSRSIVEIPEDELPQATVGKLWVQAPAPEATVILIETADIPSIVPQLRQSGYAVTSDRILPFENGIRVVGLRRVSPKS